MKNKIYDFKEFIKNNPDLPVMFNCATFLIPEEIEEENDNALIDFDWNPDLCINVSAYNTRSFFVSTNYFRPISKYEL